MNAEPFERFNDRAREALRLAREEARQLGDQYVGTEHVLLGLLHEKQGIAAGVLAALRVDADVVRTEGKILGLPPPSSPPPESFPITPRGKRVIDHARAEADLLGDWAVKTEHVLLGLLREDDAVALQVLANLGVTPDAIRGAVLARLGPR